MPQSISTRHFLGGLESDRVGYVYGPDDAKRIVQILARTFHLRVGSIKVGDPTSVTSALDYALRRGEYAKPKPERVEELRRRVTVAREGDDEDEIAACEEDLAEALELDAKADELEFWAGDYDAVRRASELVEASAVRREGPFAERLVVTETFEVPADTEEEQRAACAETIVADWNARHGSGHPAVAAVHCRGLVQPHIHVLASARPIGEDGAVDRSVRLWAGPHAKRSLQEERERVAEIINRTCEPAVLFHHGRLADTHIYREPKKRLAGYALEEARARMDADPGRAGEIEAEMHAASEAAKAEKSADFRQRREEREREKREKPVKKARAAVERAEEARKAARKRYEEIAIDNAPVPEPAELNEDERERLVKRLEAGGRKDVDPTDARTQALGFAQLRLDRARSRLRKRRKELDAALAGEETLRRLADQVSGAARAEAAAAEEDDEARRQELERTARIERRLAVGDREALTARLAEAVGSEAAGELVAAFEAQQASGRERPAPETSRGTVEAAAGDASPALPASRERPGAEMPEPLPEEQREREAELRKRHSGIASLRKSKERNSRSPVLSPDARQYAAAHAEELGEKLAALEKEMEASRGGKDVHAMRTFVELGAAWRKEGKRLEDRDPAIRRAAEGEREAIRREAALRGRGIEEVSARQEARAAIRRKGRRRSQGR